MATSTNDLTSNITRKLARVFLKEANASRVLTKSVNTQLLSGRFDPSSGDKVDFKRPHDYNSIETADGDISGSTKSDIISGKATGTVQNFITQATEWSILEEAIELDQVEQILAPMATRSITTLELNLGKFMLENSALSFGTPGTAVDAWGDVAGASSLMQSVGVPSDSGWWYAMNPFTTQGLADTQSGLASGSNNLVDTAWKKAQIDRNFGGMRAITSNALKSFTSGTETDRIGALDADPIETYVAAKDTMTQVWAVKDFGTTGTIVPGDIIEVTGKFRLGLGTRETILGADGAALKWRATVVVGTTLIAGAGSITVTGPAINETDGQYNTVNAKLEDGDILTLIGAANQLRQPNLFYHEQAFGLGTVNIPKLFDTDTSLMSEDGFSIRVSKYSDGDANKQKVRFDILPAFAVFNPFFAGQGYGQP